MFTTSSPGSSLVCRVMRDEDPGEIHRETPRFLECCRMRNNGHRLLLTRISAGANDFHQKHI